MWDTDGSTTVSDSVGELVDGLGLVEAGETLVVVRSVNGDVLGSVFLEGCHELLEVFFATFFTHELGGEVGVHAGTVPVAFDRLTVPFDVEAVVFAEAKKEEARHPDIVSGFLGAFSKDLEFPLAFGDLGVDAFVVDACVEAE